MMFPDGSAHQIAQWFGNGIRGGHADIFAPSYSSDQVHRYGEILWT